MATTPASTIRLSLPQALARAVGFHQKGQLADAEPIYQEILKFIPDHFDALHMLGVVRFQQGRPADAIPFFERAMAVNPNSSELLSNYGIALRNAGRRAEALEILDKAIKLKPNYPEALANCGHTLADLGRIEEALESFDRAILARRGFVDALVGRGIVLIALRRYSDALVSLDRALSIDPNNVDALVQRAGPLCEFKRFNEALASCDRAIALAPNRPVAHYNRGVVLGLLGRSPEALASYERALALAPDYPEALFNRGNELDFLGRDAESIASYRRVLEVKPDHVLALNNLGNMQLKFGHHDDAIASYLKCHELAPDYGEAYYNHGNVLLELERIPEAFELYNKAVSLRGDHPDIPFNEGLTRLIMGDLKEGLKRYEGRFDKREQAPLRRNYPQPRWDGSDIAGKRILLHCEQGFGDTIQFARYVPIIARTGAQVILEVQPELKTLFANIEGATKVIGRGEKLPEFDVHQYLVSTPLVLGTELDTIPGDVPYVHAAPDRIEKWRQRIPPGDGLKVGLVWSGNALVKTDRRRSIGLAALTPLLSVPGVQFISLHKEVRNDHLPLLRGLPQIVHFGNELEDFSDTAGLIANLDLVIGSDTSVVHLAGAMAKPLWILTKLSPDWRWLLKREDSPWYPTAKLYRQIRLDDWATVIERVKPDLAALAARK